METHNELQTVHDHEVVDRHEIKTNVDRPPLLSWGAVFGGLVFVVSISWLLNLLGLAMGVSIADVTDGEAIGAGLSTGAVIWMVISWSIAFFVGSLLTARLSGKLDDTAGMMHGIVLWGVTTMLLIVLGYMGLSSLFRTGYSVVENTASTAMSAAAMTAGAAGSTVETVANAASSRMGDNVKARLKRRASRVIARMEDVNEVEVSEIQEAIESLDSDALQDIATHLTMGEMTQAREELVSATNLSEKEVKQLLKGIEAEFEEHLDTDGNKTGLIGDISNSITSQLADAAASLDEDGGPSVSKPDIREAIKQLDRETMQTVSMRLINGDAQGAKDALAANTSLSTRQINDIVDGVSEDVSRTIDRYQKQANEVIEAGTTYTQGVLWTIFVAGAMSLAVSLLGGWMGTESSRRLELEVRRDVIVG